MGFCEREKEQPKPHKKIKRFPKHATLSRTRFQGDIDPSIDSSLTLRHHGAYGIHCEDYADVDLVINEGSKYRKITDTSGLIQNWWNPVEHIKYLGDFSFSPFYVNVAPYNNLYVEPIGDKKFNLFKEISEHIPKPSDNDMDDLAARSLNHFRAATDNGGESLANFFIEIYQAIQLNVKALKKYGTLWEKVLRKYEEAYQRYLKQGHSSASSAWLAWNFAIKTNIGDLKRLACSFYNAQRRFRWLQKRNHKPTKVQYRVKDCFNAPDEIIINDPCPHRTLWDNKAIPCTGVPISLGVEFESYFRLTKVEYSLDYFATGWVMFNLPDWLFEKPGLGLGLLWFQQEGITNPVKIVWNAIPYTWLLDWFVSYRTHLQEQAADLGPYSDAMVIKTGHSFKLRSTWDVTWVYVDDNGTHEQSLGPLKYDTYVRKLDLPESREFAFRVPWEGYNLSIVAALVSQRWTRRR